MSIPTAELTISEITKLQDIFVSAQRPLTVDDFIDAFRSGLRKRVDERLMNLLFALIDADDRDEITWFDFQNHIELVRADTQQNKEKLAAVQQIFEDQVEHEDKQIKELYHTAPIIRVVQPDHETMVTASLDGTIKKWDSNTLRHMATLHNNSNGATDACFDQRSGLMVIANCDQTVSLYDLRQSNGKCLRTFLTCRASIGDEVEVFRRQFRYPKPTPTFTFHGRPAPELEGSVLKRYWEAQHSNMLQRVWAYRKIVERFAATSMPATTTDVTSIYCRGDEGRALLYLGLSSGGLHIYNPKIHLRNDDEVAQAINPVATWRLHQSSVNRILCEEADEMLITCGADSDIHMTHLERGIILKTLRGSGSGGGGSGSALTDRCHTRGVKGIALSKALGSRILASWGLERYAILWDPLVGKPTHTLDGHMSKLVDLVFSPVDSNLIFTYSEDHTTKIWDRRTYRLLQQLRDHPWDVNGPPGCLHYDAERKSLVTASHRLYWKHPTNRSDEESHAHTLPILSLSCCDAESILVSCDERSVRIWNLKTMQLMSKWPVQNVQNVCVDRAGVSVLVETGPEELRVHHSSNGTNALLLSGSAKPPYLAELSHRFLFWDLGYWVVATAKQLLIYDATTDPKTVMYPNPTFKKELWGLTDRIICMIMCDGKLIVSLQDGTINFIVVGKEQPLDPKHQPFIRLEPLPRKYEEQPLLRSFLGGPLHAPPRQIIVDANKLRLSRLSNREVSSILDEIPQGRSDKDDRIECMASLSETLVIGSRNGGILSLWNLTTRREVFRFLATSHSNVSVTVIQTGATPAAVFVADESGYVSVFDMSALAKLDSSELIEATTEEDALWYGERVRRVRWFRVDVGVISDISYCKTLNAVFVATTTPCLMMMSPTGERLGALGLEWPPNPPTNAAPYETLLRQYRQEVLMHRAESGSYTAHELSEYVMAHHRDVFENKEAVVALLSDMCPDMPECELERLMEKTAGGVYVPLHAKPLATQSDDVKRKEAPLSTVDQVRDVPMVAVWQSATEAFEVLKQTKPFTRRIAGHDQLLNDLDASMSAKSQLLPWDADGEVRAHAAADASAPAASQDQPTEVSDFVEDEQLRRRFLVEEQHGALAHMYGDALIAMHVRFVGGALQSAVSIVSSTHQLLTTSLILWRDCVQHEHQGRAMIIAAADKSFEKLRTACAANLTKATQAAARRCGFTAHAMALRPSRPMSPKARPVHRSLTPPVTARTSPRLNGRRSLSANRADGTIPTTWRQWRLPFAADDVPRESSAEWPALWALYLEELPSRTVESYACKEARVQGLLAQFRKRCESLVDGILDAWSATSAQQAEYQWTKDGVHLHCVSNPVTAQMAGSMQRAVKCASKELLAQHAFINAQHHSSIPIHCPLSCVVRSFGLVFYCTAVLPLTNADEIPWVGGSVSAAVNAATDQVFNALHLEAPSQPAAVPFETRRFQAKDTGKIWMVGLRALYPSQGPQCGDPASASRRLRPEAVLHATTAVCAGCFSPHVPLVERRRADRDGIKLIRNVSTALVDIVAQELLTRAIRGVLPMSGEAVTQVLHEHGVNVFYLSVITFTTIRLCSAIGVMRRVASTRRSGNTAGVIRAADEGRRVATADESSAPQRLIKLLFTELIARTFRQVLEREMRDLYLQLALQRRSNKDSRAALRAATTTPSALRSACLQLATRRVNDLLLTGNSLSSLQFWNDHMANGCTAHFVHGEFGDRLSGDDCDVLMTWHRVEALCGIDMKIEGDQFVVRSLATMSKSIKYELPFSESELLQYGIEHHSGCDRALEHTLKSLVGPERWWAERHRARIAVRCAGAQQLAAEAQRSSLPAVVARNPRHQSEWARLETLTDLTQGRFEMGSRKLDACLAQLAAARSADDVSTISEALTMCSLVDAYQWTGQHGQLRKTSEAYLMLVERAVASGHRGISFLDLAHAQKTTAKTLLAIPAQVLLHRRARDLLLSRFEVLRRHLPQHHPAVVESLQDVAISHVEMEEEYEGIEIFHRVANLAAQHMGVHHKITCRALENIGAAYTQVGDYEKALATYQGTLERRIKGYPNDAGERTVPHLCMVELCIRKGDLTGAMQSMNYAASASGSLTFDSPVMLLKLSLDARLAALTNDIPAAIAAWTKTLDARERSVGSLSVQAADALQELGRLLFEQEKYHESWHCFDVCFGIRCKLVSRHHPSVALTMAWLARSEAAAGDRMGGVEGFQLALELFDAMCNEDAEGSSFPKLKAQALVDVATLLFKDVEEAHKLGTPLDVKRLMVVGRNHQAELARAVGYLSQAEQLMMPLVMDAHHASIRAMRILKEACEELTVRVTQDEEAAMAAAERVKRIETWAKPQSDRPHDQGLTGDALWYRKSHKIFRLR